MESKMKFAVFDTETTGLPFHFLSDINQQPRIIEFGGIITDGNEIFDRLEFICNPGIAIEAIITQITGLTNEDLDGKPDFGVFIPKLCEFFAQADAAIAHNLSFDEGRLTDDLNRRGAALKDISYPALGLCTVEQTAPIFGRPMKLIELYRHYVGEYEQKHRALDDVIRLHEVCRATGLYSAFERAEEVSE
jgi:DNA polymerase III epsilon subunit-like protein